MTLRRSNLSCCLVVLLSCCLVVLLSLVLLSFLFLFKKTSATISFIFIFILFLSYLALLFHHINLSFSELIFRLQDFPCCIVQFVLYHGGDALSESNGSFARTENSDVLSESFQLVYSQQVQLEALTYPNLSLAVT